MGRDVAGLDSHDQLEGSVGVGVVVKPGRVAHGQRLPDTLAEPEDAWQDLLGWHVVTASAHALNDPCKVKFVCQVEVDQVHPIPLCLGPFDQLTSCTLGAWENTVSAQNETPDSM